MSAGPFSRWERAVAARYLRAKRKDGGVGMISVISFVGVSLAVMVLIVVMSVMNGFRAELLSRILGFEGHAYVMGPQLLSDEARPGTIQRLKALPQVVDATPIIQSYALVTGDGGSTPVTVSGLQPSDIESNPLIAQHISLGGFRGFGEGEGGGELILIGQGLADSLQVKPGAFITLLAPSAEASPLGLPPVQTKAYEVGGTFKTGMSEYDNSAVLMPLAQAQLMFGRTDTVDAIQLKLKDPDQAPALIPLLERAAGPGARAESWQDRHASFFTALNVEHVTMRLILGLLVVLAAMNIISGLIMLVKNKGRDIAILRTMGASQSSVLRIFAMAGAMIGVTGTLTGVILGVLIGYYIEQIQDFIQWVTGVNVFNADVYYLSHIPAQVHWSEVGGIALFSCAMSVLCSLPPAWRASRLDPVEALRYE